MSYPLISLNLTWYDNLSFLLTDSPLLSLLYLQVFHAVHLYLDGQVDLEVLAGLADPHSCTLDGRSLNPERITLGLF